MNKNSKMDLFFMASSKPFTHGQISWKGFNNFIIFLQADAEAALIRMGECQVCLSYTSARM